MLLCYSFVLLCYCVVVLLCCFAIVLLCCCVVVLLYCFAVLCCSFLFRFCFVVLLCVVLLCWFEFIRCLNDRMLLASGTGGEAVSVLISREMFCKVYVKSRISLFALDVARERQN